VQRKTYINVNNLRLKVLEITDIYKRIFHKRVEEDHIELFWNYLKEQLQQHLSVFWSDVQQTVVDETTGDDISGLCLCKRTPFVLTMDAECPLLTFSRWLAEYFMTIVVSCYSNAGVRYFNTQCKVTAVKLT